MTDVPTKLTEAMVLELLRDRHTRPGNGGSGEFAFLTHVRNAAGFDAKRTFDAVTVNLWPSRGLLIDVFEVKVSRSDWQRELAKPDKAEDAFKVADRFTVVAPAGCVQDGELPPGWGLLEVIGDGNGKPWRLRTATAPQLIPDRPATTTVSRAFAVGLLRSCPGAIPGGRRPAPSQEELDVAERRGMEAAERKLRAEAPAREREELRAIAGADALRGALQEAGLSSFESELGHLARQADLIARALKDEDAGHAIELARINLTSALDRLGGPLESPLTAASKRKGARR